MSLQIDNINKKLIKLGVTGSMSSGKTFTCEQLVSTAKSLETNIKHISIDNIRRYILGESTEYIDTRKHIVDLLGKEILNSDNTINRISLGNMIFNDTEKMKLFKAIMLPNIKSAIEREVKDQKGLVLVEWALLIEDNMLELTDNNVLLINCSLTEQIRRLENSDLPKKQMIKRINCGLSFEKKTERIRQIQDESHIGRLIIFDTTYNPGQENYKKLFNNIITALQ